MNTFVGSKKQLYDRNLQRNLQKEDFLNRKGDSEQVSGLPSPEYTSLTTKDKPATRNTAFILFQQAAGNGKKN